jgi:hypothetical protein
MELIELQINKEQPAIFFLTPSFYLLGPSSASDLSERIRFSGTFRFLPIYKPAKFIK